MECRRAEKLLERYTNEGLAPEEQHRVEGHLRGCPGCREKHRELQSLLSLLRSMPPPPPVPEGFAERLTARVRERGDVVLAGGTSQPGRSAWSYSGRVAGALATIAAGLMLGVVMARQTWQYSAGAGDAISAAGAGRSELVYELDLLSGSPRGSFTDAYLTLTRVPAEQET